MRLARVVSTYDQRNPTLDRLVETADMDVLQLDYVWPQACAASPIYAPGLLRQLRTLHKTLYLDPNLHLITNAGGGDPRGCVEDIAQFLCEHGDAKLPLTAIRGDNVLPCLEEFQADGIELRDIATGATLDEMTQPLLAAQVELGAGPLSTALAEGSRFVVAGCYDLAAPAIAAAVIAQGWSWDQVDELAQLAVAVRLPQTLIEIDQNSGPTIRSQAGAKLNSQQLRQLLLETADEGCLRHADIDCQISEFELQHTSPDAYRIAGINGQTTSEEWLLRLTYQDGYFAEAQFECKDAATGKNATGMLEALLGVEKEKHRTVQIDLLSTNDSDASTLVRVRCHSQGREPCIDFDNEVTQFLMQSKLSDCELTGASPRWQPKLSRLHCHVPRDAIAVSVDTRPAKEWN